MRKKIISSILIIIILVLWMPIEPIRNLIQEYLTVQAVEDNNITTIDLTGITSGGEANHTHIYEGKYDTSSHWEECWICNKKINIQTHHLATSGTAGCKGSLGYQTQYCTDGCGYNIKLPKVQHTLSSGLGVWYSSHQHYRTCTVCGDRGLMTERCTNSQGQELTCGRAGTCRVCGTYFDGSHAEMLNGKCNTCKTKLAECNITAEIINEKTTRIYCSITPINGVEIDTNNAKVISYNDNYVRMESKIRKCQ